MPDDPDDDEPESDDRLDVPFPYSVRPMDWEVVGGLPANPEPFGEEG